MARPSKLTPELMERIVRAVRAGNYPKVAARAAGISPTTYYRWMSEGEKATRGIKIELLTIKNCIVKANHKRHEYRDSDAG